MTTHSSPDQKIVTAPASYPWFHFPAFQLPILLFLFSFAAAHEACNLASLSSDDIWWHLRTGLWIVQNEAIPRHGLFSRSADSPWMASSWLYEVLLAFIYKLTGLRALPMMAMLLKTALAVLTFLLAGGRRGNFWVAVGLSAVAQYLCLGLQPLPIFTSVLLFGVELLLLLESHRSGKLGPLFWLPFLFLAWANLHLQFIIGLCVLVLFVSAELSRPVLEHWELTTGVAHAKIRPSTLTIVLCSSVLATFFTPYTFRLFPEVLKDVYSKAAFQYFEEMSSMRFRQPRDYVLALMVMTTFLVLGRRRSWDPFKLGVMVAGTLLAFRITRDGWCVLLLAVAILGVALASKGGHTENERRGRWTWEKPALAVGVLAVLTVAAGFGGDAPRLISKINAKFPAKAADFIQANHIPQPLFNSYSWGGFLIWYLPEYPVSIDSRAGLYGGAFLDHYSGLISGSQRLESDPLFSRSGAILLEKESSLARALTTIPTLRSRYRVAYSDDLAVVFVPTSDRQAP